MTSLVVRIYVLKFRIICENIYVFTAYMYMDHESLNVRTRDHKNNNIILSRSLYRRRAGCIVRRK